MSKYLCTLKNIKCRPWPTYGYRNCVTTVRPTSFQILQEETLLREETPPSPTHSYAPYISNVFALNTELPEKVKVVICGGGILGSSLAYHLAELGLGQDTLLLEQGRLGGPMSWRGSGFLGGVKFSKPEMDILKSSLDLVKALDREGHDVGWKNSGSLHLARTKPRLTHFRKMKAIAEARGTECYMLKPNDILDKCSVLNIDDLEGGFWVPNDGVCDLYKLCFTLLRIAREKGVHIMEGCPVNQIQTKDQRVVAVETARGIVECDIFINSAGMWARKVGQMTEPFVKVPNHPAEHYYMYTYPLELPNFSMPAVRDPDGFIYFREHNNGVMAGFFEKMAKPAFEDGILPEKWHKRELPADWDHFSTALEELIHRIPTLKYAVLNQLHNSADGFSPDSRWILGLVPEFENYFVASGMKSGGSNAATGIGKMLAEWIVHNHPPMDAYELDILRFLPAHNNRKFLRKRVAEVPGIHYCLEYPFADFETGRCLRMSPIFPKLKAAGAHFSQVMGYERPSYFIPNDVAENDQEVPFKMARTDTWTKPPWFNYTAREYRALRETCGILDYSSFAKFDIWSKGKEAVDALQYLCSNDIDIPVGGICHTGMQNIHGGYENDCSLARIAQNHYMMIAPSIQQTRCLTWMQRNLPKDGSVVITDVTSMYTALCLMGPRARLILSELTDVDLSPKSFPFFSIKLIDVGLANGIRAMNLTHTGELGWVLYIPNEDLILDQSIWMLGQNCMMDGGDNPRIIRLANQFALHVYENIIRVGKTYGLVLAGYYAMRSLRVEKFYAFWGQDLDSTTTPLECGRVFRTKLHKDIDFLGRSALEKQQVEGVKRLYVHLTLEDHDHEVDNWPWGGEPIYRNGKFAGVTTTTGYGFTLQKLVCLGFIRNINSNGEYELVTPEYVMEGEYEVNVAGIKYSAKVSLRSPNLPSKFQELDTQKDRYIATRT